MSLLTSLAAYKSPALLLLVIFGPSLLPRILSLFTRRKTSPHPAAPPAPFPPALNALLAAHCAYYIYQLIFPPFDIFSHPRYLPLLTPNAVLRKLLLGDEPPDALDLGTLAHPLEELLLQKLQSLDNRIYYVRFGHQTMVNCVWCSTLPDYLLCSLPGTVAPYIVMAVTMGVMSWQRVGGQEAERRAERWRTMFAWILLGLAAGEVGVRYAWDLRVVMGDTQHLSPLLDTLRSLALLLLPIIYVFLPLPAPAHSAASLIPHVLHSRDAIRLSALARGAANLNPENYRASVLAQRDPAVQLAAQQAGMDTERIRQSARQWIAQGWDRMLQVEPAD